MGGISIHAPHARSDIKMGRKGIGIELFQSTLLMRGATRCGCRSDGSRSYFNPRSSCEERRGRLVMAQAWAIFQSTLLMRGATSGRPFKLELFQFQSTLLMRGATNPYKEQSKVHQISIHAPHARSDAEKLLARLHAEIFQSTLLMRGATSVIGFPVIGFSVFQSTLLMRGAT